MDSKLQFIMIAASSAFLCYIVVMLRNRKIELKYMLAWLFAGAFFLAASVFPRLLGLISGLLNIVEPVNTLFLLVLFFVLLVLFALTIALSRNVSRVKTLAQEIGILKMQFEKMDEEMQKHFHK